MDEKLKALAEALWPLMKTKIEEEFSNSYKPKRRPDTRRPKVYIPEVDWMIYNYKLRGEIRPARFDAQGKLTVGKIPPHKKCYCSGASGMTMGQYVNNVYIPTKTLSHLDTLHGVIARLDYRIASAATIYMGGVFDNLGEKIGGGASCYTINFAEYITQEIIDNTRKDWEAMNEDQKARRLVSEPVMMEVLDILSQGQVSTEQQMELWRVFEDINQRIYTVEEANSLELDDGRRITARKIVPMWMENSIPE